MGTNHFFWLRPHFCPFSVFFFFWCGPLTRWAFISAAVIFSKTRSELTARWRVVVWGRSWRVPGLWHRDANPPVPAGPFLDSVPRSHCFGDQLFFFARSPFFDQLRGTGILTFFW